MNILELIIMIESKNPLDKSQESLLNSFDEITAILTAIGHPNRLKILVLLIQHGTYKITDDGRNYIQSIEAAYRESEARKKKFKAAEQRQELARTFLERRL
jgi:DNA-binding transcriptional ArsR family regulator